MANDLDVKSIMSISSKSENSTAPQTRTRWKNAPLHERCSMADMVKLKEAFAEAYRNKLPPSQFRNLLRTELNVEYDDEEFNILFMKINTARNGEIDWEELVSHLLLGYFLNDPENERASLQLPIMGLPTIMRSQHRHPISRILFCPDDRSADGLSGAYITASRDGMINWWSLDMTLLRTAYSSSLTSSTERELRFYDCTAKTFTLKIVITSWEYMNSILICGDVGGSVRVLSFSPIKRGPFRNQPGKSLIQLRHVDLQKRLRLVELSRVHSEWVRQVSFYSSLHCIVSCATCPDSLLMCDLAGSKTHNMFHLDKGVQCFAFDEEAHVLATGGPDCVVRVWNPFVPTKASVTFHGHHAGIVALVLQNRGSLVYSLSRDRVIKVWDVHGQVCMQRTPISAVYNPFTRELLLAAMKIAILVLDEQINPHHTDGVTHSRAVARILYNPLFKVIITCGMDSIIINWDPVTGKRNVLTRDAHTRLLHGELIPVEITAACFDPGYQLLVTGARNGTLKVWNFNTGVCLKEMEIEHMCEVTNCFWIEGRIMAVGWNRHVTEFEEGGTGRTGKAWETRHSDDVLAAAARQPLTLATSSYSSELILWKLETGQPYRRFSCTEPMLRIKMVYNKRSASPQPGPAQGSQRTSSMIRRPRRRAHAASPR
ncbi:unnamed protein product [Leptidea sinapis]|uniref:WD repeat-containing protein on Y chromosome n=1 Tax=Leptidea sinapis TaxID=189913 RepID=A0A5E4Q7L9_9NEOP|nr:unnamed protein product [Leptidea sinapis]